MKRQTVCLVLLFSSLHGLAQNVSYFVDNISGNDNYNGKSNKTAWRTLAKLNSLIFQAGDRIFLKRGQSFDGYVHLKGSGEIERGTTSAFEIPCSLFIILSLADIKQLRVIS
jgi:hypothetical protein